MKRVNTVVLGPLAVLLTLGLLATGASAQGAVADVWDYLDGGMVSNIDDPGLTEAGGAILTGRAEEFAPELEIVEERGQKYKVFRDAEAPLKRSLMISSVPLHYLDGGVWKDIDLTFEKQSDGRLAITRHHTRTYVGAVLGSDFPITLEGSRSISLRMGGQLELNAELADGQVVSLAKQLDGVEAIAENGVVTFPRALGGDLVVTLNKFAVMDALVLYAPPAGLVGHDDATLVLSELVEIPDGLTVVVDGEPLSDGDAPVTGEQVLLVDADGVEQALFVTPTTYERESPADLFFSQDEVAGKFRIRRQGNQLQVEKLFPAGWFLDAERAYPVVIDPQTILNEMQTTTPSSTPFLTGHVRYNYNIATEKYQAYPYSLAVEAANQGGNVRHAWLRFAAPAVHYDNITSVQRMELWMRLATVTGGISPGRLGLTSINDEDPCYYDGTDTWASKVVQHQTLWNIIRSSELYGLRPLGGEEPYDNGQAPGVNTPYWCIEQWHRVDVCGTCGAAAPGDCTGAYSHFINMRAAGRDWWALGLYMSNALAYGQFYAHNSSFPPYLVVDYTVECTVDGNCFDGLACTSDICNSGRCENPINSGYCLIGGTQCVSNGVKDPANECQACISATSNTSWTPLPTTTVCNDLNPCTHTDRCNGAAACVGQAYTCNDNVNCTSDACNGDGTCTYTLMNNYCYIDNTCRTNREVNPSNSCQECRADWWQGGLLQYQTQWGYDDNNACNDLDACTHTDRCETGVCVGTGYTCDDGLTCTSDSCDGDGTCTFSLLPGFCLINGVCYDHQQVSPFAGRSCEWCDTNITTSGWSARPAGSVCAEDGFTCTTDVCNATRTCLHNINLGTCLIGSTCYNHGDDAPTNPCRECNNDGTAPDNPTGWTDVPPNTVSRTCYPTPAIDPTCVGGCEPGGLNCIGICHGGIQWCESGAWNACAGYQCPETDLCDALDNDCDGNSDEDFPLKGQACDGGDPDECQGGSYTCKPDGSAVECVNDGASGFFTFAEGSGTTTATVSGTVGPVVLAPAPQTPAWTSAGWMDNALVFDGVDDYAMAPAEAATAVDTAFTFEAYVSPSGGTGVWQVITGLFDGAGSETYIAHLPESSTGLSFVVPSCGTYYAGPAGVLPVGQWTHVAAVFDNGAIALYVDGYEVLTDTCVTTSLGLPPLDFYIGAARTGTSGFYGALDDVVFYNYALTPAQVKGRARLGDYCNEADDDCDGLIDEGFPNKGLPCDSPAPVAPGDYGDFDLCQNGTFTCHPDGLQLECINEDPLEILEVCDGIDNDCDGLFPIDNAIRPPDYPDIDESNADNDGAMVCEGDCDDNDIRFDPTLPTEYCDGFDNLCDENLPIIESDLDGDNHLACVYWEFIHDTVPLQPGASTNPLDWEDCDDNDPDVHKDFVEWCDGRDNDCDGLTDDQDPDYRIMAVEAYVPIGALPDTTITMDIYGRNFWLSPSDPTNYPAYQLDLGYGVTVNSISFVDPQQIRAEFTVKPLTGDELLLYTSRDFVLTQGLCQFTVPNGFDVVDPNMVPTLSEWGVILLSALLLLLGAAALRRRRLNAPLAS